MVTVYQVERFLGNIKRLHRDIYSQPRDESHTVWAVHALDHLLPDDTKSVLDIGCGRGFLYDYFVEKGIEWRGVTLGEDAKYCVQQGLPVDAEDMTFLSYEDNAFDLVLARHTLEHSPFPLLTLMEWYRVARQCLILIAPAPEYWTFRGRNHYSIAPKEQILWWLLRTGWHPIKEQIFHNSNELFLLYWRKDLIKAGHLDPKKADRHFPEQSLTVEYRFLCEKGDEILQ